MKHSPDAGFTLVEMLVTMVLGVLFVGTLYQLYIVTIQSATEANRDAKASYSAAKLLMAHQRRAQTARPIVILRATTHSIPMAYLSPLVPLSSLIAHIVPPRHR